MPRLSENYWLNVGVGPEGYGSYQGAGAGIREISIDLNPKCRPEIACDLLALPFRDESFDRVTASHVLEHLDPYDIHPALLEMKRVLKRGGILHIRVPDAEWACKRFLENPISITIQRVIFGANMGGYHKMGFTAPLLAGHVELAGLKRENITYDWAGLATTFEDGRIEKRNFREIRLEARRKDG